MIDQAAIEQIIAQYVKHGWTLRRVLLSGDPPDTGVFGDAEIVRSRLDAIWLSRSSQPNTTAWELRNLSLTPYALVTGITKDTPSEAAEEILNETESRMLEVLDRRAIVVDR